MSTLGQAVTVARGILQDTSAARYSDSDCVQYGNDALTIIAEYRPEMFMTIANMTAVAGCLQTLSISGSMGLVDVITGIGGLQVREMDDSVLDQFRPSWQSDPPGNTRHWARQKGSKFAFYLYPRVGAPGAIQIEHVYCPSYTINQTMDNRLDPYVGVIADYIVGMCEARESESADPKDQILFLQQFVTKIKAKK